MADSKYKRKFSSDETAAFCDQMAIIINGGITIPEGIYMLYSEMEDKYTKAVLKDINDKVKKNIQLYVALKETKVFPEYMVNMVRIGEITGKLEEVMAGLAKYYERESSIKTGIKNVISYPIILFAMMSMVLFVLTVKILPMFQEILDELNYSVSGTSENIMDFGMKAGVVVAIVVTVIFVMIILVFLWNKTKSGKKIIHNVISRTPVLGKLMRKMGMGKFISSMSFMVSSGLDTEEALGLSQKVVEDKYINNKLNKSIELIKNGKSFDEALRDTGVVKGMEGRMISVAMKTGVLDTVLQKMSIRYDEEIENSMSGISTIIETTLTVLLSIIVGAILISVMLPLVSIISSIG